MNPGTMRHVVQILRPSQVQDETGQKVDGWVLVATARAEKRAAPGVESVASGPQTVARVPTTFVIRWPHTYEVDSTMRIAHLAKVFQVVTAVDEKGRRAQVVITCEELTGEPPWLASA
jgi:SPP1 family predicted phage head-tail adaptor